MKRYEAKEAGEQRYFTGKPCLNGHTAERNTITGNCVTCMHEASAIWRAENHAASREASAEHYKNNRAYYQEYYAANKTSYSARDHKRRASKLNAMPAWDAELTELVTIEATDLCSRRKRITGFAWHIDHMVPLQSPTACGLHVAANLQVIPEIMNRTKGNRMMFCEPGEWIKHA